MQTQHYSKIQILPEHIIDQIKAGEVIERPSTLLKELLENSIDAGASKISIEIINNGMDLLVVKDNGQGMAKEDLELAFLRHATSKIEKFEDIYNLHSYGFRGEALASMASVSRITCVTNRKNAPESTIKINGALIESLNEDQSSLAESKTEIFIKDLFYNTPARMKFVKSKTAEKNQLQKIIHAFLLTHPHVEFSVKWDDKAKRVYKKESHIKRIQDVTEKNFQKLNYLELTQSYDDINIKLFISHESSRGAQGKSQFIFINDRVVQNIQIHKIITNSASKIWGDGLSGHYCLFIELPSDQIDVNVHPNKTVIKFFEAYKVHSLISASIKSYYAQIKDETNLLKGPDQAQLFQEDHSSQNFENKSLQYKEANFSQDTNLQNYFDQLDNKTIPQEPLSTDHWAVKMSFEKVLVLSYQDKFYLFNKNTFISFYLHSINPNEKSTLPLLISQPLEKTKNSALLIELNEYGFEIDSLEQGNLVLRSIPEDLKDFNYQKLTNLLLASKKKCYKDAIKVNEQFYLTCSDRNLLKEFQAFPLTELLKQNILKELTQEDLLNVF